jgi:hypothetical protein
MIMILKMQKRLVFYNIDTDIDRNGIPDQWTDFLNLKFSKNSSTYTFQNTNSYIRSQKLNLKSNATYTIIIESKNLFNHYVHLNNILKKQKLKIINNSYRVEFKTKDIENNNIYLYIYYNNGKPISFENIYIFQD